MSLLAIELNDCGLVAVQDAELVLESPGYAFLGEREPAVGLDAARQAYLAPSQVSSRFWDELSTTPLPATLDKRRTHADLVYAHMQSIWDEVKAGCRGVVLAVPSFYNRAQLELLLGISQAMDMPVVGLVDLAVAATPTSAGSPTALHLDLYLHRAALTRVTLVPEIARTASHVSREVGMVALENTWATAVARRFVRETRFDPQHSGRTEQALHDELPALLKALQTNAAATLSLSYGTRTFDVTMTRNDLADAAATLYRHLISLITPHLDQRDPVELLLSARLAALPGLSEKLAALGGLEVQILPSGAGARGALERREAILQTPGSLALVTRLPGVATTSTPPTASQSAMPGAEAPAPTHILYRGVAHPLGAEPFVLGRELAPGMIGLQITSESAGISRNHCSLVIRDGRLLLEDHSTYGTYVNGERVQGAQALAVKDRIRLGTPGEEFQVIALL
ncbi:MAG: FHA domain-containing protein [Gammaproteobacteria bacterium]|nr:FHA domain-containing protein [Gammaproteobacteria bacterium]